MNQYLLQESMKPVIYELARDERIRQMSKFIQHGNTTCLRHCISVAYCSLYIAERFHLNVDKYSMVRGALLHDYFLYDWHMCKLGELHGFHHPRIACENAKRDFDLNPIEEDIIRKHMWPLTPFLPVYLETWVVSMADKYCSMAETIGRIRFACAQFYGRKRSGLK